MYKVFLKKVLKSYKDNEGDHRFLAGGFLITDESSAALFCGGLTALLLSLELMSLTVRSNWHCNICFDSDLPLVSNP